MHFGLGFSPSCTYLFVLNASFHLFSVWCLVNVAAKRKSYWRIIFAKLYSDLFRVGLDVWRGRGFVWVIACSEYCD